MPLFNKIFNRNLIKSTIRAGIINGRGSIRSAFPLDFDENEAELIASVAGITMTSHERLVMLIRSLDYIVQNRIEGDIVECGVWRGGSMALAARRLIQLGASNRKLYLFDTFEGMPPPTDFDRSAADHTKAAVQLQHADKFQGDNVWCYSTLEEVRENIDKAGYPPENIIYIKGKVEETLPEKSIENIALLRLDTDWYESTKHELETLFDKLVPGGIMIIDDYGHWSGAKKAVDEFFAERKMIPFLNRIDYTGRLFIKN